LDELKAYKKRLDAGENPIVLKKELALRVTEEITSKAEAEKAQKYFEKVFQKKEDSEDIKEKAVDHDIYSITELLVAVEFAGSKSIARRLVEQGAVKINNKKVEDWNDTVSISSYSSMLLKVGKQLCHITLKT